jgi:alpha-L-fucosidase
MNNLVFRFYKTADLLHYKMFRQIISKTRSRFNYHFFALIICCWSSGIFAQTATDREPTDKLWGNISLGGNRSEKDYQWYQDAKFAMFIHWGLYSEAAGVWKGKNYFGISEWIMKRAKIPVRDYESLTNRFNPVSFDADAIAQLAVDAGMKYIVITSKHHDGFAMYHSKVSKYNVVDATPFGRDPLKELAEACNRHGLKLGFYYSQSQDWHEKDAIGNTWDFKESDKDFQKYLNEKALPQIEEILTGYGDIGLIFFDTPAGISREQVIQLKERVAELQPNCMINSRIGQGLGDFATLGDSEIPDRIREGLWETPDTHNNTWAYSKLDINWKSDTEIIHRLIRILCKGGNYMFNIGPKGDGTVPEESVNILRDVGKWIRRNEEAIYGTLPVDLGNQVWLEATQRPGKTYLFIREWPVNGKIWLPSLHGEIDRACFLVNSQSIELIKQGKQAYLHVPTHAPDPKATVIVLEHDSPIRLGGGQWIVAGMNNELFPHTAKLEQVSHRRDVRWMEIFGDWHLVPTLQDWKMSDSSAEWEFYSPEPGRYFLEIEYSCDTDSDLKEGLIGIDGEMQPFVPVYTGDTWSKTGDEVGRPLPRFMTRRIGIVDILAQGNHTLSIKPNDNDPGGWIRLSKIMLTPAN